MKIIENNYPKFNKKIIEFTCTCPNCQSVLGVNEYDVNYNKEQDEKYVICPCCNSSITDEYFDRTVTLDNISYPFDFYEHNDTEQTKHLSDEEINLEIRKCINYLKKNPNEAYMYVCYGDTFIGMFDGGNDYHFIVSKNLDEIYIDKA